MKKILAICGSVRETSSNLGVLLALKKMLDQSYSLEIYTEIDRFPHFNPDLEVSEEVKSFQNKLQTADVFLISTPEYAHGYPGVLKNALDWLVADEFFPGKKTGILVGSTGDGRSCRESLLEVLKTMSASIDEDLALGLSSIRSKVSKEGELKDQETERLLKAFLARLLS